MSSVVCVGTATVDYAFAVESLPVSPGKHFAERLEIVGGGPAANAAVTVVSLGGTAALVGRVGDDLNARVILEGLSAAGVDTSRVVRMPGLTSPVSAVLIDQDAERVIVNHRDERLHEAPPTEVAGAVAGADVVLADMRWPEGSQAALEVAAAAGVPGVLDYDSHTATEGESVIAAASHVIFSAPALATLADTDDPEGGLQTVSGFTNSWLAVTLGAEGVIWLDGAKVQHVPALEIDAVDTLGAGDVFHGAFALALAEGRGIREAIRRSSAAAAIKCTRFGGRAGIPSRHEVESFLREN